MYVEIRPYDREHKQRASDLAALFRYLFIGRDASAEKNHQRRLGGPPVASRVIQRISPFGKSSAEAAYDVAHQIFAHARMGPHVGEMPYEVYKHVIIGFPIGRLNQFTKQSARNALFTNVESNFLIAIRVVRELLDAIGIGMDPPSLIVIHDDRKHVHAHVVVGMYARELDCSQVFQRITKDVLLETTSTLYAAHGWDFPNEGMRKRYAKRFQGPV